MAFSEYMNFKIKITLVCLTLCFDKSFYKYIPSKVFSCKIFRIFLQWPSMNFVWNASQSINHNILWIIFLWSALDFFNYVLKKMFRELEKNVVKLVLAQQRMLLFSILDKFDFRCNICTKKLNFCSVVMLSIYFCCELPSDNGVKISFCSCKKKILFHKNFLKN